MNNQARWQGVRDAVHEVPEWVLWPRLILRLGCFSLVTVMLLPPFFLFRAIDRLRPGAHLTHLVVYLWARIGLSVCGISIARTGTPLRGGGALIANHASWIDIFVLHCTGPLHFVAKSEVMNWPLIGFLARISGTEFIERRRAAALQQKTALQRRLFQKDNLCLFAEGTSTDGQRVLPFKSTLFGALYDFDHCADFRIQPVSVIYLPPTGLPRDFYGWWGNTGLLSHVASVLARSRGGQVKLVLHTAVNPKDFADRKAMSLYCENQVRAGVEDVLSASAAAVRTV